MGTLQRLIYSLFLNFLGRWAGCGRVCFLGGPAVSVSGIHVEVLKGLRVNTLVSRSHSLPLLNKGGFVEPLPECFLNMFQAV